MATSVVSFAIERLGDLLIAEGKFLSGVCNEVEEIKVELRRMKCFLRDADEKQHKDERVRNWVIEIQDLAYRTEDLVEIFVVQVASKREAKGFKNAFKRFICIFSEGKALHKVGIEIDTIKNKLTNLTSSLQRYGIQALSEAENSKAIMHQKELMLRKSYPHEIDSDFVGMEIDIDNLMSLVAVNEDPEHRVILIKGMGGQGKTTIARKIYNHPQVQQTFEAFAWVCVTQECDWKKVIQDIFRDLLPSRKEEIAGMGDSELVRELYKVQQQQKCLVVLDDVWKIIDWKSLSPAFPINETSRSKVLLTSRKLKVGFVYELRSLTEDEGWELLQKKAFHTKKKTPNFKPKPEFENLGRKMVTHCEGLPLAIVVLGGILKDKSTPHEWEIVDNDIHSYLKRGEGVEEDHGGLAKVLAMSYDDLPYSLKQCFMYFGNFPEDYEIGVDQLGLLWIAEGLVSSEDKGEHETKMDVVERFLNELGERSMLQIVLNNDDMPYLVWTLGKKYTSFRIHDFMRDMAISKCKEAGILNVVDSRTRANELSTFMTTCTSTKTRRLAVYSNDDTHVYDPNVHDEKTQHLRSLLFIKAWDEGKLPIEMSGIREFKFLRVLSLEQFIFTEKDLQGIKELTHLRYLSFAGSSLVTNMFPSFIGNFPYMEILLLPFNTYEGDSIILPNVLWKLKRLRHLILPSEWYTVEGDQKLRLDGLTALESLFGINTRLSHVSDIFQLPNLSFLSANIYDSFEDLKNIIRYMKDAEATRLSRKFCLNITVSATSEEWVSVLRELFSCIHLQHFYLYTSISKFPSYNQNYQFSPGITKIHLLELKLEEDPMRTLENFPNLLELLLNTDCYVGKEIVCSSTGFPRLQMLKLIELRNLEKWEVAEGSMPNLCNLQIWRCDKLKELPEGLKFCHGLKNIKVVSVKEEFNRKIQVINGREGEDYYKIKHVPSIVITSRYANMTYRFGFKNVVPELLGE